MLDMTWEIYGLPTPEKEFRFHPKRRWRFDYCWSSRWVACEIEGGIWNSGRHIRSRGYLGDLEKYNEATKLGWRVFRFTPQQLKKGEAQAFIKEILKENPNESNDSD